MSRRSDATMLKLVRLFRAWTELVLGTPKSTAKSRIEVNLRERLRNLRSEHFSGGL